MQQAWHGGDAGRVSGRGRVYFIADSASGVIENSQHNRLWYAHTRLVTVDWDGKEGCAWNITQGRDLINLQCTLSCLLTPNPTIHYLFHSCLQWVIDIFSFSSMTVNIKKKQTIIWYYMFKSYIDKQICLIRPVNFAGWKYRSRTLIS